MRTVALLLCLLALSCTGTRGALMPDELTIFGSHTSSDSISGSFGGKYGSNNSITGGGDSDTIGAALTWYLGSKRYNDDWGYRAYRESNRNAGRFDLPGSYVIQPIEAVSQHDGQHDVDLVTAALSGHDRTPEEIKEEEDAIEQAKRAAAAVSQIDWPTILKIAVLTLILGVGFTLFWQVRNGSGVFSNKKRRGGKGKKKDD